MAVSEDIARLVIEVEGSQSLDEAKMKVRQLSEELGHGATSSGGMGVGYAALEASRALEDLQYGFNGVVNNIPGLVMALGGTAGLTAVISLVSVGVNQLITHWDEYTGNADRAKEATKSQTEALKEQTAALEALNKVQTEAETKATAARKAGVAEAIAPDKEQIRKALAEDIRKDLEAERERLTGEIFGRLPPGQRDFAALMADPRFARVWRRIGGEQREADLTIGRAIEGGRPELGRLTQLFGPETEIGMRLAEAGPERAAQRAEEERDVAQQTKMARLDAAQKQKAAQQEAKDVAERQRLSEAIDRENEQKKRQDEQAERHRQAEQQKAEHKATTEAHKRQTEHDRKVREEAAVATQRFGGTAEMMAERGAMMGMNEQQIRGELSQRLMREGVGKEAAQAAAQKATNAAMGKLLDEGGKGSALLRLNAEMTRQMAERLRHIEGNHQEAMRSLQAVNQTNRKTGN